MIEYTTMSDHMVLNMESLAPQYSDNYWVQDVEGIYYPLMVAQVRVVIESLRDTGWDKH